MSDYKEQIPMNGFHNNVVCVIFQAWQHWHYFHDNETAFGYSKTCRVIFNVKQMVLHWKWISQRD